MSDVDAIESAEATLAIWENAADQKAALGLYALAQTRLMIEVVKSLREISASLAEPRQ